MIQIKYFDRAGLCFLKFWIIRVNSNLSANSAVLEVFNKLICCFISLLVGFGCDQPDCFNHKVVFKSFKKHFGVFSYFYSQFKVSKFAAERFAAYYFRPERVCYQVDKLVIVKKSENSDINDVLVKQLYSNF